MIVCPRYAPNMIYFSRPSWSSGSSRRGLVISFALLGGSSGAWCAPLTQDQAALVMSMAADTSGSRATVILGLTNDLYSKRNSADRGSRLAAWQKRSPDQLEEFFKARAFSDSSLRSYTKFDHLNAVGKTTIFKNAAGAVQLATGAVMSQAVAAAFGPKWAALNAQEKTFLRSVVGKLAAGDASVVPVDLQQSLRTLLTGGEAQTTAMLQATSGTMASVLRVGPGGVLQGSAQDADKALAVATTLQLSRTLGLKLPPELENRAHQLASAYRLYTQLAAAGPILSAGWTSVVPLAFGLAAEAGILGDAAGFGGQEAAEAEQVANAIQTMTAAILQRLDQLDIRLGRIESQLATISDDLRELKHLATETLAEVKAIHQKTDLLLEMTSNINLIVDDAITAQLLGVCRSLTEIERLPKSGDELRRCSEGLVRVATRAPDPNWRVEAVNIDRPSDFDRTVRDHVRNFGKECALEQTMGDTAAFHACVQRVLVVRSLLDKTGKRYADSVQTLRTMILTRDLWLRLYARHGHNPSFQAQLATPSTSNAWMAINARLNRGSEVVESMRLGDADGYFRKVLKGLANAERMAQAMRYSDEDYPFEPRSLANQTKDFCLPAWQALEFRDTPDVCWYRQSATWLKEVAENGQAPSGLLNLGESALFREALSEKFVPLPANFMFHEQCAQDGPDGSSAPCQHGWGSQGPPDYGSHARINSAINISARRFATVLANVEKRVFDVRIERPRLDFWLNPLSVRLFDANSAGEQMFGIWNYDMKLTKLSYGGRLRVPYERQAPFEPIDAAKAERNAKRLGDAVLERITKDTASIGYLENYWSNVSKNWSAEIARRNHEFMETHEKFGPAMKEVVGWSELFKWSAFMTVQQSNPPVPLVSPLLAVMDNSFLTNSRKCADKISRIDEKRKSVSIPVHFHQDAPSKAIECNMFASDITSAADVGLPARFIDYLSGMQRGRRAELLKSDYELQILETLQVTRKMPRCDFLTYASAGALANGMRLSTGAPEMADSSKRCD